ncbi:hypothetical protein B0H11DRAFT_1802095 [Mycena galericulata]|nr:hypothetical protein B0H11DRAFT_1802095 [Mycena galericulata]
MRAHLARMSSAPDDPAPEATARYLRIRNTADPEVHLPYLRTMLALRRPTHLPQIVDHLCAFLARHANPDHRFAGLLWEIVLAEDVAFSDSIQARILATLWTRIDRHPYISAVRNPKPPRYVFDTISRAHVRLGVTISQLCAALATALFPHLRLDLPSAVWKWAATEARAVFSPQSPAPTRWRSLVLLALYTAPTALPENGVAGARADLGGDNVHVAWRTVFGLALLERTVPYGSSSGAARLAIRRLWLAWKNAETLSAPPLVPRVVVGAFLRLAARTRDGPLKDGCQRYCATHGLWGTRPGSEGKADVAQTTEMFVDYVYAALHTGTHARGDIWTGIFAALPPGWSARVADALFRAFMEQDVAAAQELYAFCDQQAIDISTNSAHALALVLAGKYFPEDALRFLGDPRFSPDQLDELLEKILRTLRRARYAFRDIPLADALAPALARLYLGTDRRVPRLRSKFSLRYALSVLIASGRTAAALPLLRTLHQRRPAFFSIHYLLRTMRALVNAQQPAAALALLPLVRRFSVPAVQNFRRKLVFRLAFKGANRLAEQAYRFGGVRRPRRTTRESLARAVGFLFRKPPHPLALKIGPVLARRPTHVPTLRLATTLLVRARRVAVAWDVLERAHAAGLKPAVVTWLGNAILDASELWAAGHKRNKHVQPVPHLLAVRDLLVERFGFVPDRVTLNIMLKARLRWRAVVDSAVDSAQIRRLFDHMVRSRYPAPARWRRDGGVPFGTAEISAAEAEDAFSTVGLPPFISFNRHVRPMYRMFVKALHLRRDQSGARTVVGILHAAEEELLVRRQLRRRARFVGILRKNRGRKK